MTNQPSLEHMVGQMFVCGFPGHDIPTPLMERLQRGTCGGIILFARNIASPEQIAELNAKIAQANPSIPPWIGVDQEGGRVARLRSPFTELPPAAVLGELDSETWAERFGEILGEEAAAVGFNLVFAPVMDVHTNPNNPVIGDRSLATTPEQVARLGMAYANGLMKAKVMPCAKHFPGHGDTDLDSHKALPKVAHERERLESMELKPFQYAAKHSIPSMMTAHVLFPALEPEFPATMSTPILRGILRDTWGFDGLLISDDLEMKGVAAHYPLEEIVVRGAAAGVDVFLLCLHWEEIDKAIQAILDAVQDGRISREQIEASYERNRRSKEQFASYQGRSGAEIRSFLEQGQARRNDAEKLRRLWTQAQEHPQETLDPTELDRER